jgi:phage recombination protein Bet
MNEIQKNQVHTIDVEKLQTYLNAMGMANNLTKGEFQQFVEIAQGFGLNPFKREIYANKYGNQFSVIVGFETYIKRAERSGLLSGWSVKTNGAVDEKNPRASTLRAEITIHRRDFQHPFVHEVYFSEYFGVTRDGSMTKFWREKPMTMIKKVAMAQGFRLCFSDELGGMPYTAEELNTMDTDHVVVNDSKPKRSTPKSIPDAQVVTVEPTKPVTFADEINRMKSLLEQITSATAVDDLVTIWKNNSDLHGTPEFKNSLTNKRKQLENPPIESKPMGELKSPDEMIELIAACATESEVLELTMEENRREILDAAIERVAAIQMLENQNGGEQ